MKPSVNEATFAGLWARNCATIQQVLIQKFAFGPEKLPGLSRNWSLGYRVQNAVQGIHINDWNLLESSTWNPYSTAWNPESKIVGNFLTWGNRLKKTTLLVPSQMVH